jgi:prepilin-type N-terminal cleavage/methylation domain-containing protein/prepilin-type processing-associated H-X9-DG protein
MTRRAFTLTELLVSIAVMSLLLGLLLPALASVKQSGRTLQCQSNQRQMTIAAQTYATLWDVYPTALRYESVDGAARRVAWDWVTTYDGAEVIEPGPLWASSDDPHRVMQCPDYHGPSNFEGDPFTGYNYNTSYVGGEAAYVAFGWEVVRRGVPPHACRRTDSCAMFGCGGYAGGANKFMRAPGNPEGGSRYVTYAGAQAFRHGDATVVAFLDGHVEQRNRPHAGIDPDEALLESVMDYPDNGFLSDDDKAYDPR